MTFTNDGAGAMYVLMSCILTLGRSVAALMTAMTDRSRLKRHGRRFAVAAFCVVATGLIVVATRERGAVAAEPDAFAYNRLLGRGINLANALDAPHEGDWGVTLKAEYFQLISQAGFNSVRLPIRWSAHAQSTPPYTIDPKFFERVDWAIDQALSQKLSVVIDLHHFIEMDRDPVGNRQQLLALWDQIARRFQSRPPTVFFELFNEPQDQFTDDLWNEFLPELLEEVRRTNPSRMIIIGPGYWNGLDHLSALHIPDADQRLIVTFHYYKPFHFTHQMQPWLPESMAWKGTSWGSAADRDELHRNFEIAANWSRQHRRPLYLGEFGVSEQAQVEARALWSQAVIREARRDDFSWAYYQFCSNFGVYDAAAEKWNQTLLDALVDQK
jgi:endoglucanase